MAPKLPTRNSKTSSSSSSSSTPKKPSKRKFTPKTHTTAGVALGKSKKAKKDPKKKQAALLQRLEKELPKLNMITPVGVVKPKGKKKGKVFVEDREKMMGILNRVNDDKDGRIQSKLERSRQLEAIREGKRKEEEARTEERKSKMQGAKDAVRRKRKRNHDAGEGQTENTSKPRTKKVAFA